MTAVRSLVLTALSDLPIGSRSRAEIGGVWTGGLRKTRTKEGRNGPAAHISEH